MDKNGKEVQETEGYSHDNIRQRGMDSVKKSTQEDAVVIKYFPRITTNFISFKVVHLGSRTLRELSIPLIKNVLESFSCPCL